MELPIDIHISNIDGKDHTNVQPIQPIKNNLVLDINKNPAQQKSTIVTKRSFDIITYNYFKHTIYKSLIQSPKSKTLDGLNIKYPKTAKKPLLEDLLFSVYKFILKCDNNEDLSKIISIQQKWKLKYKHNQTHIYGPGIIDKSLCKNTEDCFTMETIDKIPDKYFFSIKDSRESIFFFDVRTFNKLVNNKSSNPFTREPFSDNVLLLFKKRKKYMKKNKISIIFPEEQDYLSKLTPEQKIQNKLFKIFQSIDELNVIAEGTQINWFNNLNINQLKQLYKVMEDVWNYRANLTAQQKNDIVPGNYTFGQSLNYVFNCNDIILIQNILLTEMETLVSSSTNPEHRNTGAYYILISLTEISMECAQAMPWLVQY